MLCPLTNFQYENLFIVIKALKPSLTVGPDQIPAVFADVFLVIRPITII